MGYHLMLTVSSYLLFIFNAIINVNCYLTGLEIALIVCSMESINVWNTNKKVFCFVLMHLHH